MTKPEKRIRDHLTFLYGKQETECLWPQLEARLTNFRECYPHRRENIASLQPPSAGASARGRALEWIYFPIQREKALPPSERLSERDAILITYGDQINEPGRPPLQTLADFLETHLRGVVSGVHLLPFYPYSSDDGFSVIDYRQVNPRLGTWGDVARLGRNFQLMFDAVINHISRQSRWFQAFSRGQEPYTGYFIVVDPETDLSMVARPRALPLLTAVETVHGTKHVWTTFSDDQIDLNYANPQVLLEIVDLLLFYVAQGAEIIRLDAIAYLWKEIGSPCIHLPQTHRAVKLFRAVLDIVAPDVLLITETNVPHEENISYFGALLPETSSTDEAQMVYQFSLAPLVVHSILEGKARVLSQWAAGLETPPEQTTFFNFTASHDGIGVMPARRLLSEAEIQAMVDTTLAHGGRVSYKANPDGSQSVYELNISYFDALSDPAAGEPLAVQVARFTVSQAIMLALAGVPGIYAQSILGSRSWHEGVAQTGRKRTINRQKFDRAALERELADPTSLRHQVFTVYNRLLRARATEPAFHPHGAQRVPFLNEAVFTLLRTSPDGSSHVLCLHNVSGQPQPVQVRPADLGLPPGAWRDLLTGEAYTVGPDGLSISLPSYAARWLKS